VDWFGDSILARENMTKSGYDLKALSLSTGVWRDVAATPSLDERDGQFSPDGRWVAYQSNENGADFEIWVVPFNNTKGRQQVAVGGGEKVRWWPDGRKLLYVGPEGLMSVDMVLTPDGQSFVRQQPRKLFPTRMGPAVQGIDLQQYMVRKRDGRILMSTLPDEASMPPITLILNWRGN
jgi:hypothetical protein